MICWVSVWSLDRGSYVKPRSYAWRSRFIDGAHFSIAYFAVRMCIHTIRTGIDQMLISKSLLSANYLSDNLLQQTRFLSFADNVPGQHLSHPGRRWWWRRRSRRRRQHFSQWEGVVVAAPPGPPELEDGAGGRCPGSDGLWSHPHWNYRLPPALLRRRPGKGFTAPAVVRAFPFFWTRKILIVFRTFRYRTYCCRIDTVYGIMNTLLS